VVDELALQLGAVVPVVEGACPGEEVQIGLSGLVVDMASDGLVEDGRPVPAVSADFGLEALEGLHRVFLGSFPHVRGLIGFGRRGASGSIGHGRLGHASCLDRASKGPIRTRSSGSYGTSPFGKCSSPKRGLHTASVPRSRANDSNRAREAVL